MAKGIGQEALSKYSTSSDVDLYRYRYLDEEVQLDGSSVKVAFVSPVFTIYEKHRFTLLKYSKTIQMKPRWRYRPDYLSYDEYGTTSWWQLLMWINDVKSVEYFTQDKIIVPELKSLQYIENEAFDGKNGYIDINEDDKHSKTLYTLYITPRNNLDTNTDIVSSSTLQQLTDTTEESEENTQFVREVVNLTIPMLRLKYIDLKYEPIVNSLKMLANCRPNLIYNKHYTLINDNDKSLRRITWDPEVINNAGLLFKLKENDCLEIQYVRYI